MTRGWRSRGHLPHCDERGLVQHVVFGLADAMPKSVPGDLIDPAGRADWADRELDRGLGSRLLANAAHAAEVERCLLHGDAEDYALAAWCVMPTHVHVVVEQFDHYSLADMVQAWKSVTARTINASERRRGAVWRREYFDRFMRSEEQYAWTVAYVENNPVVAGLAETPESWLYSSARWRRGE